VPPYLETKSRLSKSKMNAVVKNTQGANCAKSVVWRAKGSPDGNRVKHQIRLVASASNIRKFPMVGSIESPAVILRS